MGVAIYTRVSSKSQDAASQLPDLQRWAKAQDGEVTWHTDQCTGKSMDRPGWARLWANVLDGSIDQVVVWRLDRLGRTASGLTQLFEELVQRKVNLVSLKDGLDLSTPAGRLMANVLASVAVYETEVRSERQLAGIAAAKAQGVTFGRKVVGAGNGKPVSVTDEKHALVWNLHSQGTSIAKIARLAGLSRTTVYKILG